MLIEVQIITVRDLRSLTTVLDPSVGKALGNPGKVERAHSIGELGL